MPAEGHTSVAEDPLACRRPHLSCRAACCQGRLQCRRWLRAVSCSTGYGWVVPLIGWSPACGHPLKPPAQATSPEPTSHPVTPIFLIYPRSAKVVVGFYCFLYMRKRALPVMCATFSGPGLLLTQVMFSGPGLLVSVVTLG